MSGLYGDLDAMLADSALSRETIGEILAILNRATDKIPPYRAVRLLMFLSSLKTGDFSNLASRKRPFLENVIELLFQNERSVSRICHLFFEQRYPEEIRQARIPEDMAKSLIAAGKTERFERVKILVWDLLLRQGDQLARLISPEDIAFAPWLDAPLTRNKLIMFMVRYFGAEKAMRAFCTYASKTGKKIPSTIAGHFMELVRAETQHQHRMKILSDILQESNFTYEQMDRLWSEHLSSQNRFGLIRIFSSDSDALSWMEELKERKVQLTLNFRPASGISDATAAFASRVHAIRSSKQRTAQVL